jgi:TetR/AcrR family transcriptional regulator, transcriptional repressor for nem operon
MRYDAEHKQRTRRRVLCEAAAAIRQRGPDRIGVAELMAKAGRTHGGFYAHFESKDELIAEAITEAFDDRHAFFLRSFVEGQEPARGLAALLDRYLSAAHRSTVQTGCPLPSLSGDVSRLPLAARQRFTAGTARLMQAIASLLRAAGKADADELAASMLAEMVGALALSRAVADVALSDRILRTSRDAIKRRIGLQP